MNNTNKPPIYTIKNIKPYHDLECKLIKSLIENEDPNKNNPKIIVLSEKRHKYFLIKNKNQKITDKLI